MFYEFVLTGSHTFQLGMSIQWVYPNKEKYIHGEQGNMVSLELVRHMLSYCVPYCVAAACVCHLQGNVRVRQ